MLRAAEVGEVVRLGRGEPRSLRLHRSPCEMFARVCEAMFALGDAAEHGFGMDEQPRIPNAFELA